MSQSHSTAPPGEEEEEEEVKLGWAGVKMKGWQANEGEMEGWLERGRGGGDFFFN